MKCYDKKKKKRKFRVEGNYLNLIKSISNLPKNSTVNNILHDERMNAFPLKSGTRQGSDTFTAIAGERNKRHT